MVAGLPGEQREGAVCCARICTVSQSIPLPDRILTSIPFLRYYCLSILDKHHHPDIDYETGLKILRMCTDELQRRLPIDFKGMTVKVIRKGTDGKMSIEEIAYDTSKQVLSA